LMLNARSRFPTRSRHHPQISRMRDRQRRRTPDYRLAESLPALSIATVDSRKRPGPSASPIHDTPPHPTLPGKWQRSSVSGALARRTRCRLRVRHPWGAILPVYGPLLESTRIRHVLVRQEQADVHAATGYVQAAGNGGGHMATSGPGATNLVTPARRTDALCSPRRDHRPSLPRPHRHRCLVRR